MKASFYKDAQGVLFFKLEKDPVMGSSLADVVEVHAEPAHKEQYSAAWKAFLSAEEVAASVEEVVEANVEASGVMVIEEEPKQGKKK